MTSISINRLGVLTCPQLDTTWNELCMHGRGNLVVSITPVYQISIYCVRMSLHIYAAANAPNVIGGSEIFGLARHHRDRRCEFIEENFVRYVARNPEICAHMHAR